MNGANAIIEKIIADAKSQSQSIVSLATTEAEVLVANAKESSSLYEENSKAEMSKEAELIVERRKTVARLDGRKVLLQVKQRLVDECFEEAEKKILALSENDYLNFMTTLIEKNCDDGDRVVLCEDEKYINEQTIKAIAQKVGKTLTLSTEKHNLNGGVILRSSILDKNLSIPAIVAQYKTELKKEVAGILFE